MEKITANHSDSQSADLIAQHIEQLSQLFPEVIKEGKVDFEALQDLLGNYTDTSEERFQLNWAGKSQARREAQKRSTGTLRPCPEESVDWDITENLYIEGDNLEVLKLLQKSYYKKVKMIYIDPPYNTGNDFVYKDNYSDNLTNYLEISGQDRTLGTNTESDGRYHSNWLNMMYPRLKLALNLLTDDGVIFISIDDNEVHNLRKMCDEVFGEDNCCGVISRIMKSGGAKGRFFSPNIEYILVYSKKINETINFREPISDVIIKKLYTSVDTEGIRAGEKYRPFGLYQSSLEARPNQRYYIKCPDNTLVIPPGETFPEVKEDGYMVTPLKTDGCWRWSQERYIEEKKNGNIVFKKSDGVLIDSNGNPSNWNVYSKIWLSDREEEGMVPVNLITKWENRLATKELSEIGIPFDFAKPSELIKYLILIIGEMSNSIILDFFSGSASTAHSVMQLNAEDGGNRKYIMVQLPETTPEDSEARKAGYKTIAEIGKERIRRAGKKIVEELKAKKSKEGALFAEEQKILDIGFKVFKLDSSNINTWDSSPSNLENALYNSVQNIKSDRTELDLLYEILLKYGIDLVQPINEHTLAGKKVYEMGAGALIVCMADHFKPEVAEAIAQLWKAVRPTAIDESSKAAINCRVVFKDNGFDDNNDKTNVLQILKQHGIDNVVTI